MRILAIDTATEACSVALWLDGDVHERFELAGREHSVRLLPMLQSLLAEAGVSPAQLDGIACGVGPGSFAGVRIGVGFVKGLALGLDRPVVPVSSLAMLAQGAMRVHGAQRTLAAIDARMQEVYFGLYLAEDGLAVLQGEERVAAAQALPPPPSAAYVAVGSGWQAHGEALQAHLGVSLSIIDGQALPHAADALLLAQHRFACGRGLNAGELQPAYLRNRVALTKAEQEAARKS